MVEEQGLRPYQIAPVNWLVENGGGFIRADMGAGKTFIAERAAKRMGYDRLLIVAPSSALYTWVEHMSEYAADAHIHVLDGSTPRQKRIEQYKTARENNFARQIVIVTAGQIRAEPQAVASFQPDICIWDEAHRLFNRMKRQNKTKVFAGACRALKRPRLILLSGNRRGQGPHEWWSILHLLDRRKFPAFWKFVNRYFYVDDGMYGQEIVGLRKDAVNDFNQMLRGYVFNIPSKELEAYLPSKIRQRLPIALPRRNRALARELYNELCADLGEIPGFESNEAILAANQLVVSLKIRQLLACPALIAPELGPGPAIKAVVDHAESVGENKIVIFTPFPEAFEWFERYLRERGFSEVYKISGDHSPAEVIPIIARQFDEYDPEKKSALLASIDMAEGYNIRVARVGYFCGFSWDEDRNTQAEGRLMRGDKAFVNIFYVTHINSIDQHVLERMRHKRQFNASVME